MNKKVIGYGIIEFSNARNSTGGYNARVAFERVDKIARFNKRYGGTGYSKLEWFKDDIRTFCDDIKQGWFDSISSGGPDASAVIFYTYE